MLYPLKILLIKILDTLLNKKEKVLLENKDLCSKNNYFEYFNSAVLRKMLKQPAQNSCLNSCKSINNISLTLYLIMLKI